MEQGSEQSSLSAAGAATVAAILAVVVTVSLPRLHAFANAENESDAAALTRALGLALAAAPERPDGLRALVADVLPDAREDDLEWLADGRLLRRHGYLFELGPEGVLAWPWSYGGTGRAAFVFRPDEGVLRHANAAGLWTGPDRPPAVFTAGWSDAPALEPGF